MVERSPPASETFRLTGPFQPEQSRDDYLARFDAVQHYIRAGDCYQINLAQRFSAPYSGDLWHAYCRLRRATPTPFAGFIAWGDQGILSLSPERFLHCADGHVETRPIKAPVRAGIPTPKTRRSPRHSLPASRIVPRT